MKRLQLEGKRFGRLLVMEYLGPYKANPNSEPKSLWRCQCDCGNTTNVVRGSLTSGLTKSCGCYSLEVTSRCNRTHGKSGSEIYRAWAHAIGRCHNKNDSMWKNYGGRGIKVCKEWRASFELFADHIGDKPSSLHTLDRINNDGNYEPGNVRWATRTQQANNKRNPPRKTHCKRGHIFDDVNTYWVYTDRGKHQSCRKCRKIAEDKRQIKRKMERACRTHTK